MPESFGVRLRQQRERQQIALAAIAEQTKIKLSLLEELERDDVSHWPTGIFRRAFIRAYAAAIGLDQDLIVREFLELYPDPPDVVEPDATAAAGIAEGVESRVTPPIRLRYLVGSAIDSLSRLRRGPVQQPPAEKQDAVPVLPAATDPSPRPAVRWPPDPPDLSRLARLCTDLARLSETHETVRLLNEVAALLDAVGVIVWAWDPESAELRPAIAHGYSDRILNQLPRVRRDADNATAAAYRSAQVCVVRGSEGGNGALVIPIVSPGGCVGVLAAEVRPGAEDRAAVRAVGTIVAAQLARFVETTRSAAAADRRLA
jgi:transcriptional regulator with XRE-family HTH domain